MAEKYNEATNNVASGSSTIQSTSHCSDVSNEQYTSAQTGDRNLQPVRDTELPDIHQQPLRDEERLHSELTTYISELEKTPKRAYDTDDYGMLF